MTKHTKELRGMAVSCLACYGMLLSFGGGLGQIVIARFLLCAGLGVALFVIVLDSIRGHMVRSLVGVLLWCIVGLRVGYAPYWYLQRTYADRPLFNFGQR